MAKKEDKIEETETVQKVEKKVDEKIEQKVEKAVDAGAPKGKAENIIGEVKPPEDLHDKAEVKAYFKAIDDKLERLLAGNKKEEPPKVDSPIPIPTPKKQAWFDKELF